MSQSRRKFLGTVTAAGAVGLAGCPDDGGDGTATETAGNQTTTTETTEEDTPMQTQTGAATVRVDSLEGYGSILVDSEGMTLYMFTQDEQGADESACPNFEQCDQYWPPLTVESEDDLEAGGGVGAELGVFERSGGEYDGQLQVTANGYPLYYFAGDESAGDANGIGINEAWYPVSWEGMPVLPSNPTVQVSSTEEFGDILVGPDGMTLYQFDADTQGSGETACPGIEGCDEAWPPLTVDNRNELEVGENVDAEVTTLQREDGTLQVVVNGWPLYYFANDQETGDTNGQGVNDVWWVVTPQGRPVRGTATVQVGSHQTHGNILVDSEGMTLYMFDQDTQGEPMSACPGIEGCDEAWPPLSVESEDELTAGARVEAELSTFEREDGTLQVTANGWPLYYFANDEQPGDANGQGVNDVWWVLNPAGEKIGGTGMEFESLEEAVTTTNEIIDRLNNGERSIAAINEPMEDAIEPIEMVDPVEAENSEEASAESERLLNEADRVETEAVTKVVASINETAGFAFIDEDTETAEEARDQADSVEAQSADAAAYLRLGADVSDIASGELAPAAQGLGNV